MTTSLMIIIISITLAAIIAFVSQRHHILIALLSLEATTLSLALLLTITQSSPQFLDLFICIIILTFGACEASLALAILVSISRTYGNDILSSLTSNKC